MAGIVANATVNTVVNAAAYRLINKNLTDETINYAITPITLSSSIHR